MEDDLVIPNDLEDEAQDQGHLNIGGELDEFLRQWHREIDKQQQKHGSQSTVAVDNRRDTEPRDRSGEPATSEPSIEDQARYLFVQGASAEQNGRLCDALQYYRCAVQLVPDIEMKMEDFDYRPKGRERRRMESETSAEASVEEDKIKDLMEMFCRVRIIEEDQSVCQPLTQPKTTHMSSLPFEVLTYILKWVVSLDLDVHSLEQVSLVCRGFYLCARDEELWKLICLRTWGKNCGRPSHFGSYRKMYIERPHLRFNGCYISRCCYFREGVKSLDNFYRPFHIVEYYRYIRFFPEGRVLMLSTPDNPYATLPNLKTRSSSVQGLMIGYYKLVGDRVTLMLKRKQVSSEYVPSLYRYRRAKAVNNNEADQTFEVELILKTVGGRPHWQLTWSRYSMHTVYRSTREEAVIDFELSNSSYPSLLFSPVRCFTAVSDRPLSDRPRE